MSASSQPTTPTITPTTELDACLQAMAAAPDSEAARLALYAELTRCEVFVLLEQEVSGSSMRPRVFDLSEARAVLAFDSEMRLAGFAGEAAAYAALPGRVLVPMLVEAGAGLALLLNPDADHAGFLPAEVLAWVAQTLDAPAPEEQQGRLHRFSAPAVPAPVLQGLVRALERRLSGMPGLERVVLVGAEWDTGAKGHVLALSGLPEAAQAPVARAVAEALALSGLEAGALDVIFPPASAMAQAVQVGLVLNPTPFEMPDDQVVTPGQNPGLDPEKPPKLR